MLCSTASYLKNVCESSDSDLAIINMNKRYDVVLAVLGVGAARVVLVLVLVLQCCRLVAEMMMLCATDEKWESESVTREKVTHKNKSGKCSAGLRAGRGRAPSIFSFAKVESLEQSKYPPRPSNSAYPPSKSKPAKNYLPLIEYS